MLFLGQRRFTPPFLPSDVSHVMSFECLRPQKLRLQVFLTQHLVVYTSMTFSPSAPDVSRRLEMVAHMQVNLNMLRRKRHAVHTFGCTIVCPCC